MPVVRVKSHLEMYRLWATMGPDAISGRFDAGATRAVNQAILARMEFAADDVVADVGCGDGSLLFAIADRVRLGIGVTPSAAERDMAARAHPHPRLRFEVGRVDATGLAERASKVVCNGVLLLLDDTAALDRAIAELARIAAPGALAWIGEMPETDELAARRADRGLRGRLRKVYRSGGWLAVARTLAWLGRALVTSELFFIEEPTTLLYQAPDELVARFRRGGFVEVWRGRSASLATRWDYLFKRE